MGQGNRVFGPQDGGPALVVRLKHEHGFPGFPGSVGGLYQRRHDIVIARVG
jgi:hypothetical protein